MKFYLYLMFVPTIEYLVPGYYIIIETVFVLMMLRYCFRIIIQTHFPILLKYLHCSIVAKIINTTIVM